MITKTENLTYKLKDINFQNGCLIDAESGEIVDLMLQLYAVFKNHPFELVAKSTIKEDVEITDLLNEVGE
jgi:hypothetical protein